MSPTSFEHHRRVLKGEEFPFQEIEEILYQDELEVVNPLGSAKGKLKLLGVYMMLGHLPLHCRSHVKSLQLVMLCQEERYQRARSKSGAETFNTRSGCPSHSGVLVNGVMHTVRLGFIIADNLSSHAVGGFAQRFSSTEHFRRFCVISRSEFEQVTHALLDEALYRENYTASLEQIAGSDKVKTDCSVFGNSPFYVLQHYHVCNSGLLP